MDARVPCVTSRWPCSPSRPPAPGLSPVRHSWATMTEAIQSHIGSLSWGHRLALREKAVTYVNSFGEFVEHHKVKVSWAFGPVGCPPDLRLRPRELGLRVEGCTQRASILVSDQSGEVCFAFFKATNEKGQEVLYTAAKFVIATGERPRYLGIPGDREYCITRWG